MTRRLTQLEKDSVYLPGDLEEVLIGVMLGDCYMRKFNIDIKSKSNAKLIIRQSLSHKDYLFHLFYLFQDFTPMLPTFGLTKGKARRKIFN